MNDTETRQVLEALRINRVMAKDSDGNYTREVTPKLITAAIALCKASLARVAEPVDAVLLSDMQETNCSDYGQGLFATWDCVRQLYAAPQATAQPSQAAEDAFNSFADKFDTKGDEWQDMGAGEYFVAGYLAAINAKGAT